MHHHFNLNYSLVLLSWCFGLDSREPHNGSNIKPQFTLNNIGALQMSRTLALTLANGVEMPQLGLGTWPMNDAEASETVTTHWSWAIA